MNLGMFFFCIYDRSLLFLLKLDQGFLIRLQCSFTHRFIITIWHGLISFSPNYFCKHHHIFTAIVSNLTVILKILYLSLKIRVIYSMTYFEIHHLIFYFDCYQMSFLEQCQKLKE